MISSLKIIFLCVILISFIKPTDLKSQFEIIPKIGINTSFSDDINDQCDFYSNTVDYFLPQIGVSFTKNLVESVALNLELNYRKGKTNGIYNQCFNDYDLIELEYSFFQINPAALYNLSNRLQFGIGFYHNNTLSANAEEITIAGTSNRDIRNRVPSHNYGIDLSLGFKTERLIFSIEYNHNLNEFYRNKIHWLGLAIGYRIKM